MPTTSQWTNVSLKSDTRAILAERKAAHDYTTTGGGTLPTNFSYSGYAARLLTAKEVMAGCGLSQVADDIQGELDNCNYLMENTTYSSFNATSHGHWLETPTAAGSINVFYISVQDRIVCDIYANLASYYGARPTIEVPKANMSY